MLIGGLWHGAAWKFVFWGGMHGLGLAVHKLLKPVLKKVPDNPVTIFLSWLLTFVYVSFLWVFFRAPDFSASILIIRNVFRDFHLWQIPQFCTARPVWCVMMGALVVMHFVPQAWADRLQMAFARSPWIVKLAVFLIVVQLVVEFMVAEVQPFIYFQF